MSSHHFVKEGQEPALLILDPHSVDVVQALLEWAPLVMVFAPALPEVISWGIKIDLAILQPGDGVAQIETLLADQGPVSLLTPHAGSSVFMTALSHLNAARDGAVNVVTANADDLFATAEIFFKDIQINFIDRQWTWFGVPNGRFEKWLPGGSVLKVRPVESSQTIHAQGLIEKSPLYEVASAGMTSLQSAKPFWVAETTGE
jgi:hypothetical protein